MPVSTPLNLKPENPHDSLVYETNHEYMWDTEARWTIHFFNVTALLRLCICT